MSESPETGKCKSGKELGLGFVEGFADVGKVRLHYVKSGSGDRLVILLHGFPQTWYSWRHQLLGLGTKYTVVAPDMRGFGQSDKPVGARHYEILGLVDDITGLIQHFGKESAAVIGHDWGAGVAWAVGQTRPEFVWKLGALQVPPLSVWLRNITFKQMLRSWYMVFFQLPWLPEFLMRSRNFKGVRDNFKTTTVRPGVFSDEDIQVYVHALKQPGALTSAVNYYRANFRRMFLRGRPKSQDEKNTSRVRVPTLFIFAEQDFAILPETAANVQEVIDAPYTEVRFADSNHWVQEELPDQVNAALLSFLDS